MDAGLKPSERLLIQIGEKVCKIKGAECSTTALSKSMHRSYFWKNSTTAASCLLLCVSLAGMAQENQNPPPANPPAQAEPTTPPNQNARPDQVTPGQPKVASAPLPSSGGAPVDGRSYKVGPGDVLLIRVWNEPAFTGGVAVQQNGRITLQLLGDVEVGGQTPMEIQELLTKSLTKFVNKPLVTVTVAEVGSKKYYMNGLINRPGEYPLVVPTTILEAISKAGGPQDFANLKHIYVLRGDKRIYFNYKDVIHGKHMEQNIQLQSGDYVFFP